MFYTYKMNSDDKHVIMKSAMDGSDNQILLDESFHQLGSLTVDESNEMLYWMETEEQILHSVSFSGIGKKVFDSNSLGINEKLFDTSN